MFGQMIVAASLVVAVLLVIIAIIYYFISSKGVNKQKKHFKELHENLKKDQKVELTSGIIGIIKRIDTETVDLQIESGAIMEVSRYSISRIIK